MNPPTFPTPVADHDACAVPASAARGAVVLLSPRTAQFGNTDSAGGRAHAAEAGESFSLALAALSDAASESGGRVFSFGAGFAAGIWTSTDDATAASAAVAAAGVATASLRAASPRVRVAAGFGELHEIAGARFGLPGAWLLLGDGMQDACGASFDQARIEPATSARIRALLSSGGVSTPRSAVEVGTPRPSRWASRVQMADLLCVLPEHRLDTPVETTRALARLLPILQAECGRGDGTIVAVVPWRESPAIVCAFGLSEGTQHQHHPARSLDVALQLRQRFPTEGIGARIGIASGPVFRGDGRDDDRLLCGPPLERALWLADSDLGRVVCDTTTPPDVLDAFQTELRKGHCASGQEFAAYAVSGTNPEPSSLGPASERIVGRLEELAWLREKLVRSGRPRRPILISGEPGIGKSTLAQAAAALGEDLGFRVLRCSGHAIAPPTPFGAWKAILAGELERFGPAHEDTTRRAALEAVGMDAELAPLLATALGFSAAESRRSAALSEQARAASMGEMVASLLRLAASSSPLLVVMDDAQWIDDSALRAASRAASGEADIQLLIMARPTARDGAWLEFRDAGGTDHLELAGLSRRASVELAQAATGAASVAPEVEEWLYRLSGGSPFFLRELLLDAVERQELRLVSGRLELGAHDTLSRKELQVEAVAERRVAGLDGNARALLCCASTLGGDFEPADLLPILPAELRAQAPSIVRQLTEAGLLVPSRLHPSHLRFQHELTRLAAYRMLPDGFRNQLHRSIAERLEADAAIPRESVNVLLGHHWEAAGEADRAAGHYAAAATHASRNGACAEAVTFFLRALELVGPERGSLQQAQWETDLSGSYWGVGNMAQAEAHARAALERVADPFPTGELGYWRRILADAWRLAAAWRQPPPAGAVTPVDLVRIQAARRLAESQYFKGDASGLLCACMGATSLAVRSRQLALAARASGLVAMSAGMLGLERISSGLLARTMQASEEAGDPAGMAATLGAEAMLRVGQGDWRRALPLCERSLDLCRQGLDPTDIEQALTIGGLARYFRGEFREASVMFQELYARATARRGDQHRAWGAFVKAQTLLPYGEADAAIEVLREARDLLDRSADNISLMICLAVEAAARTRAGREDAGEIAMRAAELARAAPPRNFGSLEGYAGSVEALLAQAALAEPGSKERLRWLTEAKATLPSLRGYARMFPIGRPRLLLAQGWLLALQGSPRRAQRHWNAALDAAKRYESAYDERRILASRELLAGTDGAFVLSRSTRRPEQDAPGGLRPHPIVI